MKLESICRLVFLSFGYPRVGQGAPFSTPPPREDGCACSTAEQQPVSRAANPQSSQTEHVIQGLC